MSVDHTPPTTGTDDRRLHAVPPPYDDYLAHAGEPPYDPEYDGTPEQRRGNTPSHNHTAEQAVIGAMLLDPTLIPTINTILEPGDYYQPAHEHIHDAITHLHEHDKPVDLVTVTEELLRRGQLHTIGGATYLHDCQTATPTAANATYYAEKVRDHARLRTIANAGLKLTQLAQTADITQADATLGNALAALEHADLRSVPLPPGTTAGLVDLTWILTGTPPEIPPPTYTRRTDGHALFYAGKINGIFGDPEAAKTWIAMTAVIEALHAGGTAAMIDVDHNGPNHTAARLLLLGAHPTHLADPNRFRYYEPHEADELLAAVEDITQRHIDVVIIDSIGEVFPMLGVPTNDGDEMTTALRRTCLRPADAGSCVITIDHLPKGEEARKTGFAIGTIAKKRMIRGTYLRAEARTQPAPGQIGRITLRIEKDSNGQLRKVTPGGYAGTFVLDSTHSETDGVTTWKVERENAPIDQTTGAFRPTKYMEAISKYVEENDQASGREITEGLKMRGYGTAETQRKALKILVDEGFISTIPGPRRSTLHHSIALYREAEDDHLNPAE